MALIDNVKESRSMKDIKSALAEIGVDVNSISNLEDVATAIRGCNAGPQVVVNGTLSGGHGIKVTPQDRKGYKISGNSDIILTQDLNNKIQSGTTVTKALYNIVNHEIPKAMSEAIHAPFIGGIEFFKAECDGIDYYDNKAFGKEGKGRKSGLRPYAWYLKIYTQSQYEPIYVDFGPFIESIRKDFLKDAAHQTESMIEMAFASHMLNPKPSYPLGKPGKPNHKPNKPGKPEKPEYPEYPGCGYPWEKPSKPDCDFPWDRPERPGKPEKPSIPENSDDDWCDDCEMPKRRCKCEHHQHHQHHHKHDKPQHGLPTTEPDGWLGPQIFVPPFDFDGDEGMMFDEDGDCDYCEDLDSLIKKLQA